MNRYEYLERATASIPSNRRAADVRKELQGHIEMKRRDFLQAGLSSDEAEAQALQSLGDPAEVAAGYERPAVLPGRRAGYLLALPLTFSMVLAIASPGAGLVVWLVLLAVIWAGPQRDGTVRERLERVRADIGRYRLVAWGALASGVATALYTLGSPPPLWGGFLIAATFLAVGLSTFYEIWTRDRHGRDLEPWLMAAVGALAYLAASLTVMALGHWNEDWLDLARLAMTAGLVLVPLGTLGLCAGMTAWRHVYVQRGRDVPVVIPDEEQG
jgi:hypothetical protein